MSSGSLVRYQHQISKRCSTDPKHDGGLTQQLTAQHFGELVGGSVL